MKIIIIIPAFNEEKNISSVIKSLNELDKNMDIAVINDGSNDRTGPVAEESGKAYVINLPCNLGIGGAVQTGFIFARKEGYDIAIQFDGDGQHIAEEIPKILQPILNSAADVVIGSRFLINDQGFKSTWTRRIGIKIFEFMNTLFISQKITDNTSGFRAYNREAIDFLSVNYPVDYPEPEAVVLLGRNGFVIKEIPVIMKDRTQGKSSISGLKSFYYMIKVTLSIIMTAMRSRVTEKRKHGTGNQH